MTSRDPLSVATDPAEHAVTSGVRGDGWLYDPIFEWGADQAKRRLAAIDAGLDAKIAQSMTIIDQAIAENGNVTHLFGLYSSGNDSACSTHLASMHPAFTRAVMIDTTIAIPEAQEHGRRTAESFQWRLLEYRAPVSYREIILKHGFPGPGGHLFMYTRLKERCVQFLVRDHKAAWKDRIGLVTGVRLSESERRMGHVEPIHRKGAQLWISPILHWDEDDKTAYMRRHNIPRNPVTDKICMSGECLCGAFAKKEELLEIEMHFPDTAKVIRDLEAEAEAAGVHAKWGTRPPGKRKAPTMGGMLCKDCNRKNFQPELFAKAVIGLLDTLPPAAGSTPAAPDPGPVHSHVPGVALGRGG